MELYVGYNRGSLNVPGMADPVCTVRHSTRVEHYARKCAWHGGSYPGRLKLMELRNAVQLKQFLWKKRPVARSERQFVCGESGCRMGNNLLPLRLRRRFWTLKTGK